MTSDLFALWRDDAACADLDEDSVLQGAWDGPNEVGDEHPLAHEAKKICERQCPVREKCIASALADPEAQGIRGGYTFDAGTVPVAKAREIRDTFNLTLPPWQSSGRPRLK